MLTQSGNAAHRRQHRDRVALGQPRYRSVARKEVGNGLLGFLGHEHVEGDAGEPARWHDEEMLAPDEVGDLPEQAHIEFMSDSQIE